MNIQCEICGLKFPEEMIIPKTYSDFSQCYDCLYFMNFNDKKILEGSMGYDLKKYIEVSSKYHSNIPCNNFKNNTGCYVCMSVLDIKFDISNKNDKINSDKIINSIPIKKQEKKQENINISNDNINQINIIDNNFTLNQDIIITL